MKNEKILLMVIVFGILIMLPSLINASMNITMYEKLQDFENKNCSIINNYEAMWSWNYFALADKFGFNYQSTDNCIVIFDIYPYATITEELGFSSNPVYAELNYKIGTGDYFEKVDNGEFSDGYSWNVGSGWNISYGSAGHSSGGTGVLTQSISLTAGKTYNVSFKVVMNSSASVDFSLKDNPGTQRSESGYYSEIITAGSGSNYISFSGEGSFYLDDISVQEYTEYILVLANDYYGMEDLINFTTNYELFQPLLSYPGDYFLLDENLWDWYQYPQPYDPIYVNCVDDPNANIYTGNSGSYYDNSWETTRNLEPSCVDSNTLSYGYCTSVDSYDVPILNLVNCDCSNGKCILKPSEVFDWVKFYSHYIRISNVAEGTGVLFWYDYSYTSSKSIKVDDELVSSIVSDWINN